MSDAECVYDVPQDWMTRFGYLKQPDPLSGKLMSKEAISFAIKEMQRFGGLKVTGKLGT